MEESSSPSEFPLNEELEKKINQVTGYEFTNTSLLHEAFTHRSFSESSSYERLEFIGDAVLSFFITKQIFLIYPDMDPGQLTLLRAANVDTEKLARVAFKHELHKYIRHNKPLLLDKIKDFEESIVSYPLHSHGMIDVPKTMADVVESLIGAIFIDSNCIDATSKIIEKLLQPMITPSTLNPHPMTRLYEICQKNKMNIESIDSWKETRVIEFLVGGESVGRAEYGGKKMIAINRAAHQAYHNILKELGREKG